ncbi:MAG: ATP-binding protein, partial [Saccharothrix sp.]|nr:ATP-binding protein [Saccharothrix sp.]
MIRNTIAGSVVNGTVSYLLDTRREVVPYRSRPAEERRLERWLAGAAPMSVLLVHGAGGSGKTRLANAFAGFAHEQGWAVAQAVEAASTAVPGQVVADAAPVLVVVDYAERWGADGLLRMIGALPVDFPGRAVRVLLLARSGAIWPALADRLDRLPSELPEPIGLGDLVPPADRPRAFADAVDAFARALGRTGGVDAVPDLSAEEYGSALTLHMAALAAAYEGRPGLADLSDYLLRHEGRFWPVEDRGAAADVVLLATLFGPLEPAAARELLGRAGTRALLDWHVG